MQKLWSKEFLPNWFDKIINKNNDLKNIFSINKISNVFADLWKNEKSPSDLKRKNVKEKFDLLHERFFKLLANFICESLSCFEIIQIAKIILKENLLNILINEKK